MCQAPYRMKTLDILGVVAAVTIIAALAEIAVVAAASLLAQSASATDVMTSTTVGGEEEAVNTTTATTTNNVSNAVLGSLFLTGEDKLTSFNPINETYTEVSYVGNRTIMPPDTTTTTATINATETGNLMLKLLPNGITIVEGQSLLVTEGGGSNNSRGAEQQENATALLVDLNGVRPDD